MQAAKPYLQFCGSINLRSSVHKLIGSDTRYLKNGLRKPGHTTATTLAERLVLLPVTCLQQQRNHHAIVEKQQLVARRQLNSDMMLQPAPGNTHPHSPKNESRVDRDLRLKPAKSKQYAP